VDRIIGEAKSLWGIPLVVFSGGEPLAYRSQGKDVIDLMQGHRDCMYLMFTNGTLIDRDMAERMAEIGSLTPAISVEGLRERTEERRGQGTFERILGAMDQLRRVGVPFGISVTVSRDNCDEVLSDEFLDLYFGEQGAFYGFLFHYMPIGRSSTLEWMPTPEQRMALWRRSWDVIANKKIFLFDFWNSGPLVQGCISAGREGGYIYIDWNGKVMPCVFAPYSVANIQEAYAQGQTLNDIWQAPFFQAIRQWQREYGYGQEPCAQGNWLRPCPIRDHHALFHQWVQQHAPEPENDAAQEALLDGEYCRGLAAYGRGVQECSQPIWEQPYLGEEGA
jgi:radical SAM protein with 4Fe4S-binding SPASM domain